jgi:hypothetical protein
LANEFFPEVLSGTSILTTAMLKELNEQSYMQVYDQFAVKKRNLDSGQVEFFIEAWGFDDGTDNLTVQWQVTHNNEIVKEWDQPILRFSASSGVYVIQVTLGGSWTKWVRYKARP